MSLFRNGSKHISPIAQLIEATTDSSTQSSENWSQFMNICDMINSSEDGPKDAAKAIRKRLNCKHSPTIMLTLKLLETCVKNCGSRFHVHIATKEFMQDLIKIISAKYNPSVELQNTVLGLIQTWACAFQAFPELKEVNRQYQELKMKGVEFPALDPDQASAVYIPTKSAPPVAVTEIPVPRAGRSSSNTMSPTGQQTIFNPPHSPPTAAPQFPVSTPPVDRLTKLRSELATVQQNCHVFGDLLTEIGSGEDNSSDIELLEDLNSTCRQMQKRVVDLIESVQNEQVTEELLTINDELNNVFLRYDRYQRMRTGRATSSSESVALPAALTASMPPPPAYELHSSPLSPVSYAMPQQESSAVRTTSQRVPVSTDQRGHVTADQRGHSTTDQRSHVTADQRVSGGVAVANLIDLDFSSSTVEASSGMQGLALNSSARMPPSSLGSVATSNISRPTDRETDIAEMEKWLMANPKQDEDETTATSSEFDDFLLQRAHDNERLPTVACATGPQPQQPQQQQPLSNELFTL